jgi:hypothetical protein
LYHGARGSCLSSTASWEQDLALMCPSLSWTSEMSGHARSLGGHPRQCSALISQPLFLFFGNLIHTPVPTPTHPSVCLSICLFLLRCLPYVCLSVCLISIYLPTYLSIYLSVCLFVSLSACLSICLFIYLSMLCVYLSVYLSIYLSICLSVCIFIYLSACLSICLSVYLSINPNIYVCMPCVCMYVSAHVCTYLPSRPYVSLFPKNHDTVNM